MRTDQELKEMQSLNTQGKPINEIENKCKTYSNNEHPWKQTETQETELKRISNPAKNRN